MLISQGVAGRCYRTKTLCNVPIMDDFRTQHVRDLGFTEEEAVQFKQDRKSYLCAPVTDQRGNIVAILSFDSSHIDTFAQDKINRINEYIPQFYGKLTL